MKRIHALFAATVVAAAFATPSSSAEVSRDMTSHPSLCMPATNDLTRTTYGIRNNTKGNRSVYCGFEVTTQNVDYYSYLAIAFRNYDTVPRTVTCYWTTGQPYFGGYNTASGSVVLPADNGDMHELAVTHLSRPSAYAALGLRCVMPPGTSLDNIETFGHDPIG